MFDAFGFEHIFWRSAVCDLLGLKKSGSPLFFYGNFGTAAIPAWRHAGCFLKADAEMIFALETAPKADFLDGIAGGFQIKFGGVDAHGQKVAVGCHAGLFFELPDKMAGADGEKGGYLLHGKGILIAAPHITAGTLA